MEGQGTARRGRSAAAGAWKRSETRWHCDVLLPGEEVGFDPSFLHGASGAFGSKPPGVYPFLPGRKHRLPPGIVEIVSLVQ